MRVPIKILLIAIVLLAIMSLTLSCTQHHRLPLAHPAVVHPHTQQQCIIDSNMTLADAIGNPNVPRNITKQLQLLTVRYYSFDGKLHQGQLVVNRQVAGELASIFNDIEASRFPIARVIPVSHYHNADELSMADNNTSCFNYRFVPGTRRLSLHAFGKAIDINPACNPYITHNRNHPAGARYNPHQPGTVTPACSLYRAFRRRGWCWGGRWKHGRDYQHFQRER